MANETALQQAKAQLAELLQAAREGKITQFSLTRQVEALEALIAKADEEAQKAVAAPAQGGDKATFMKEQAAFISHAVHELRTPMTSIRGYGDMLPSMGELSEMQKQFLGVIRANSKRMDGLLTDVSDISKIQGGTLRVNPKMDTFKNIAMTIEKAASTTAQDLKRTFTVDVPQGLPLLNTDGEHLSKACIKLIENGLRYAAEDTGEVRLTAKADGADLVIEISDNGVGMSAAELAKLGTLFFRADNEAVQAHKGSGMGVAIAYGLLKALDATVNVTSEVGKGTTFAITLKGMV
jgi:signal transduction histidine kinase